MRCTLSFTCPRRRRVGLCCSTCGIRETCLDACLNSPDNCMVSRESTIRELAFEYNMKFIETRGEINKILETGEPIGLFCYTNPFESCAVDNRTGNPVQSEKFENSEGSVLWLQARVEADRNRSKE